MAEAWIEEGELEKVRAKFVESIGPLWEQHQKIISEGYTLVEQIHDAFIYKTPQSNLGVLAGD